MKRPLVVIAALVALVGIVFCSAHRVIAQEDTPQPYPSSAPPLTYDDPAMHFEAPKGYLLLNRRYVAVSDLGDPAVVAVWIKNPGQEDMRTLTISVEQYDQAIDQYETNVENDVRNKIDDAIVANRTRISLTNGMPAYFLSITSGSGFDGKKIFEVIWSDGTRGVTIAITGRLGDLKEDEAKLALATISAVRYPINRL
jgi:hypothetical protein